MTRIGSWGIRVICPIRGHSFPVRSRTRRQFLKSLQLKFHLSAVVEHQPLQASILGFEVSVLGFEAGFLFVMQRVQLSTERIQFFME